VDLFTQAIALNPAYGRAYVGLADCYNLLREFAAMPEQEAYPRALAATRRALELDDKLAEAHTSLGFITFWWNWNAAAAEREFQRAIALNPNYATAHHWYATFLSARERHQEALTQITLAQELDASSTSILADKGLLLYLAGEKDAAISLLRGLEAEKDTLISTHRYLARIYLDQRDCRNYLAELKSLAAQEKTPVSQTVALAAAKGFAAGGSNEMLEQTLVAQLDLHRKGLLPSYRVAQTYGLLGRTSQAISYLEESAKEPGSLFLGYRGDPAFRSIRADPRYRQLDARFEPFISAGTLPERP
jgi:Tfp pilus assembly protein PilF